MQLDIFEHSSEVMLRNDAAHALERRDAPAARAACEQLAREYPLDPSLPALQLLAEAVEPGDRGAFADHQALRAAREAMLESIVPAALQTFGDSAAARWLVPLWRDLAQRAAPLAFKPEHGLEHAAPLWLHAGNWNAAVQAVASIASWRRIPMPLSWMAEASLHLHGLQSTWPLLAELSWLSPHSLARVADRSPDPQLPRWLLRFEADFDDGGDEAGLAWLPAWLLTQQPSLAKHLAAAQASRHRPPEQAMRLLVELLGLERQGRHHDIVARRKALRDLSPVLYGAYIKTR